MSDTTTAPLAYMGDSGTFALEIRRCSDFALVATVEPGEERYGRIFADVVETAEKLRELAAAAEALATYVDGYQWGREWAGRPHAQMDAVRAAIANARRGA